MSILPSNDWTPSMYQRMTGNYGKIDPSGFTQENLSETISLLNYAEQTKHFSGRLPLLLQALNQAILKQESLKTLENYKITIINESGNPEEKTFKDVSTQQKIQTLVEKVITEAKAQDNKANSWGIFFNISQTLSAIKNYLLGRGGFISSSHQLLHSFPISMQKEIIEDLCAEYKKIQSTAPQTLVSDNTAIQNILKRLEFISSILSITSKDLTKKRAEEIETFKNCITILKQAQTDENTLAEDLIKKYRKLITENEETIKNDIAQLNKQKALPLIEAKNPEDFAKLLALVCDTKKNKTLYTNLKEYTQTIEETKSRLESYKMREETPSKGLALVQNQIKLEKPHFEKLLSNVSELMGTIKNLPESDATKCKTSEHLILRLSDLTQATCNLIEMFKNFNISTKTYGALYPDMLSSEQKRLLDYLEKIEAAATYNEIPALTEDHCKEAREQLAAFCAFSKELIDPLTTVKLNTADAHTPSVKILNKKLEKLTKLFPIKR